MGTSLWLPGVVAAPYVSAGVLGQQPLPYLVRLDRGETVEAHLDHPELMGLLLKIIKREVAPHVRLEAVKALENY